MGRQVFELHDAAQVRNLSRPEVGNLCLDGTARLAQDQAAVRGVSSSLLDRVGKLCWHLDDVDAVHFEAGPHFVFGPQGHETPGEGGWGAHCICLAVVAVVAVVDVVIIVAALHSTNGQVCCLLW